MKVMIKENLQCICSYARNYQIIENLHVFEAGMCMYISYQHQLRIQLEVKPTISPHSMLNQQIADERLQHSQ